MESIREIYKIGDGPSSSHTMGPSKAASLFKERNPSATSFHVILYGSLAATIGMEHFLGLTCDPMRGLVQIPYIERNDQGASRALDAAVYARMTDGHHFVPFDKVIRVMKETGHDLPSIYKETAERGLAVE